MLYLKKINKNTVFELYVFNHVDLIRQDFSRYHHRKQQPIISWMKADVISSYICMLCTYIHKTMYIIVYFGDSK